MTHKLRNDKTKYEFKFKLSALSSVSRKIIIAGIYVFLH